MSRRKQELRTNELLNYTLEARNFIARNLLVIVLAGGVVVSAVIVVSLMIGRSREAAASVWREYLNARTARRGFESAAKFRDEHPGNPLAILAAADGRLQELLFNGESDAARALRAIGEAEELYRKAESAAGADAYVRGQVGLGLGSAAEFRAGYEPAKYKAHLDAAQRQYEKVIAEHNADAAGLEAARRKARLSDYADPVRLSRKMTDFKPGPLALREAKEEPPHGPFGVPKADPRSDPKADSKAAAQKTDPGPTTRPATTQPRLKVGEESDILEVLPKGFFKSETRPPEAPKRPAGADSDILEILPKK
jgi:hypothetical protein